MKYITSVSIVALSALALSHCANMASIKKTTHQGEYKAAGDSMNFTTTECPSGGGILRIKNNGFGAPIELSSSAIISQEAFEKDLDIMTLSNSRKPMGPVKDYKKAITECKRCKQTYTLQFKGDDFEKTYTYKDDKAIMLVIPETSGEFFVSQGLKDAHPEVKLPLAKTITFAASGGSSFEGPLPPSPFGKTVSLLPDITSADGKMAFSIEPVSDASSNTMLYVGITTMGASGKDGNSYQITKTTLSPDGKYELELKDADGNDFKPGDYLAHIGYMRLYKDDSADPIHEGICLGAWTPVDTKLTIEEKKDA